MSEQTDYNIKINEHHFLTFNILFIEKAQKSTQVYQVCRESHIHARQLCFYHRWCACKEWQIIFHEMVYHVTCACIDLVYHLAYARIHIILHALDTLIKGCCVILCLDALRREWYFTFHQMLGHPWCFEYSYNRMVCHLTS